MKDKQGLPEELTVTLRQLVMNGHFRMAGTLLYVYFKRCWKLEDDLAGYYVVRYFAKHFPKQWGRFQEFQIAASEQK